jgi:hypothetical protein
VISFLFGLVSVAAGLWSLWIWRAYVVLCLKGLLPLSLIFSGLAAILMGLENLSDFKRSSKKDHG